MVVIIEVGHLTLWKEAQLREPVLKRQSDAKKSLERPNCDQKKNILFSNYMFKLLNTGIYRNVL